MLRLLLLMMVPAAFWAQSPGAEKVKELMALQQQRWNKGDIPGFMEFYWKNDSLQFIGGKGITYGWQKTLDNYMKAYPDKKAMGELTFALISVEQLNENAVYVIGRWELKKEKPSGGHFTLMWKLKNGEWRIVSDHTS